jgi:hypothetical protein
MTDKNFITLFFDRIKILYRLILEIIVLKWVVLIFNKNLIEKNSEARKTYFKFKSWHPRFKFFKAKSIGVAVIDLFEYKDGDDYLQSINGKNSAFYYARKSAKRGYVIIQIDRNYYKKEIALIELSMPVRQGKALTDGYGDSEKNYCNNRHYQYWGVLLGDKLVAYCDVGFYGNFALISKLMGHADHLNNGVMYHLLTHIVVNLINQKKHKYIVYDMWYGALPGLRMFKAKLGFKPAIGFNSIQKILENK